MTTANDIFQSTIEQTKLLREGKAAPTKSVAGKTTKKTLTSSTKRSTRRRVEDLDPVEGAVIAVVDPELSTDDLEADVADLQELVAEADEGEVPVADDYIGDNVYQCSVCGNSFFSDEEISENPIVCPVCGEQADVVLQGEVQEADDEITDDSDVEIIDDYSEDDEVEADEIVAEETLRMRKPTTMKSSKLATKKYQSRSMRKLSAYQFDDAKMNALLDNYLTSNFSNGKSLKVVSGSINSATGKLFLTCKLTFKSGKSKMVSLQTEAINLKSKSSKVRMTESAKILTKGASYARSPFMLECMVVGKTIVPTRFSYNYTVKEGLNTYQVVGSPRVLKS